MPALVDHLVLVARRSRPFSKRTRSLPWSTPRQEGWLLLEHRSPYCQRRYSPAPTSSTAIGPTGAIFLADPDSRLAEERMRLLAAAVCGQSVRYPGHRTTGRDRPWSSVGSSTRVRPTVRMSPGREAFWWVDVRSRHGQSSAGTAPRELLWFRAAAACSS